ncbi:MAG: polysaccharide deacetylase family protein [Candidatus Schekmanbacteria bacterium]|nr:polysaccharide deacetylase family protein [Candidatus Schekmanbacteria bacterium]
MLDSSLSKLKKSCFPILAYHRIIDENDEDSNENFYYDGTVSCTVKDFESHIFFLKKYFRIVPLSEVADHIANCKISEGGKPFVAITFDDGYKSLISNVIPLVDKSNIPCTFFLPTGILSGDAIPLYIYIEAALNNKDSFEMLLNELHITKSKNHLLLKRSITSILASNNQGKTRSLVEKILNVNMLFGYIERNFLSAEDVRHISSPFIEVASHSHSHADFSMLGKDEIKKELTHSREYLESVTSKKVLSFAMPFGGEKYFRNINAQVFSSSGYENTCSTVFGLNTFSDSRLMLKRIVVNEFDTLQSIKLKLSGYLDRMAKRING